jgi:hypothetical protein
MIMLLAQPVYQFFGDETPFFEERGSMEGMK